MSHFWDFPFTSFLLSYLHRCMSSTFDIPFFLTSDSLFFLIKWCRLVIIIVPAIVFVRLLLLFFWPMSYVLIFKPACYKTPPGITAPYTIDEFGGRPCQMPDAKITDKTTCMEAQKELGMAWSRKGWTHAGGGCFLHHGARTIGFNEQPDKAWTGNRDLRAVCIPGTVPHHTTPSPKTRINRHAALLLVICCPSFLCAFDSFYWLPIL